MATSRPSEGFSESDQQWFDRLSGMPGETTDVEAVQEADALRLALEQEQEALDSNPELLAATSPEALAHQWEQLQFRARREGLMPSPHATRRRFWTMAGGLAAAVLLAVVLIPTQFGDDGPDYPAPPVMRGDFETRVVAVAQPFKSAETLASALRSAGFKPGIYRRDRRFIVDVDIPAGRLQDAAAAFSAAGLVPTPGFVRIEFERR